VRALPPVSKSKETSMRFIIEIRDYDPGRPGEIMSPDVIEAAVVSMMASRGDYGGVVVHPEPRRAERSGS
jgi:hypothetical protein